MTTRRNWMSREKLNAALDDAEELLDKVRDVARMHQNCAGQDNSCNAIDDLREALGWDTGSHRMTSAEG